MNHQSELYLQQDELNTLTQELNLEDDNLVQNWEDKQDWHNSTH